MGHRNNSKRSQAYAGRQRAIRKDKNREEIIINLEGPIPRPITPEITIIFNPEAQLGLPRTELAEPILDITPTPIQTELISPEFRLQERR